VDYDTGKFLFCLPGHQKKIKRPKPWKHTEDITHAQLKQMRDEFWDTAPHYGGKKGTCLWRWKIVVQKLSLWVQFRCLITGSDSMFGCAEIWDALRAAAEADINLAQLIVDSAGIIVQSEDLSTCYDERGQLHTFCWYAVVATKMVAFVYLGFRTCWRSVVCIPGAKYDLPKYVLSEPINIKED
jgi:hypothetical protein